MENQTKTQSKPRRIALGFLVLSVLFLLGLNLKPPVETRLTQTTTEQTVVKEESAVIDAVEKSSPAVVSILARQVIFDPFSGPSSEESGIGTGFIIESEGLILTNKHVVANSGARYRVVLKDGTDFEVKEIHRDPFLDLAILKIDPPKADLPTLPLGDSGQLKVGQTVIAIGNALGRFTNTVTVGVVSGIGRGITASSGLGKSEVLDDVIQTDAALNPGNSGGPSLNLSGQVIGINVATTEGAENIGFAIPINAVKPALSEFKAKGKIVRPFLGVEYVIVTEDLSVLRKLPQGAFVQKVVKDTPADGAGLKAGDIITKVDGKDITEKNTLAAVIRAHQVGDRLSLTIDRNGKELELTITLGEAPSQ